MSSLADLHRAVHSTLASKRLGKAVFVRYLLQRQDKPEAVLSRLALATAVVRDWLGQPLARVYAIGSIEAGQVSLTLQFRDGATALVSYVRGQSRDIGVDLMLLGNHGAIHYDGETTDPPDEAQQVPERPDPVILAAIQKALRSGQPEPAGMGAQP